MIGFKAEAKGKRIVGGGLERRRFIFFYFSRVIRYHNLYDLNGGRGRRGDGGRFEMIRDDQRCLVISTFFLLLFLFLFSSSCFSFYLS